MSELFQAFELNPGGRELFEVDCGPWLVGAGQMQAFTPEPPPGCPVVFEPVSFVGGGKVAQFYASVPLGGARGTYVMPVKLEDNAGRVDYQDMQMRVR